MALRNLHVPGCIKHGENKSQPSIRPCFVDGNNRGIYKTQVRIHPSFKIKSCANTSIQLQRRPYNFIVGTLWFLCWSVCYSNVGVMGIPEFFVKGYGCGKTSSNAQEWSSTMNVGEYAIPGLVTTQNKNVVFECPDSFGILVCDCQSCGILFISIDKCGRLQQTIHLRKRIIGRGSAKIPWL